MGIKRQMLPDYEPLLKEPYNFYSSYINLSRENRMDIMERELVQFYLSEIITLKDQIMLLNNESLA